MTDTQSFFSGLQVRLATAHNETEVRDRFCGEVYSRYGITLRLERGRSDARRNRVIFEFKDKGLFRGRTNSPKFREAYSQLTTQYVPQCVSAEGLALHDYIGVAIDGEHYAFVFFEENGSHRHTALLRIDPDGLYPLLEAIKGDVRRSFTVENLLEDFGADTVSAKAVLRELWNHLNACLRRRTGSHKVQMLFQEWQKLFAQATSFGRVGRTRIDGYLLSIGLTRPLDYTKALFTLHTYNALLFKLIAAEVVTTIRYHRYSGFASEAAGLPCQTLRDLLDNRIEHAEVFVANNIDNFIEGTFFSWYLENAPDSLIKAIRQILTRLGLYVFPTATQGRIRDVVKAIYQDLVPEALRKNIGEFYTPEWLVDFVLDQTGYIGAMVLEKKLLDPCCGSGNFLIHAITRIKEAARFQGLADRAVLPRILQNIVGFDLNPLAVISSRLSYLLAIADILPSTGRIEIPVYMADAVYAPVREERGGSSTRSYKIGTVLGNIELVLPEALVQRRRGFATVLSIMERDVVVGETTRNFIAHLRQNGHLRRALDRQPEWRSFLSTMFHRVKAMERRNWNRIWCRIVRNYFASVAVGEAHVIASNPPWVRWSELPEDYRERIKPTCDQYAIFSRTPFFGGNELDISGMIAYTVTDKWLAADGILGFVITQIHFQAPSSEGFRAFRLPDGTPLGVSEVHDLTKVKPFPRLANKPAVFTWKRGVQTTYPVDYKEWNKLGHGAIPEDATLGEVRGLIQSTDKKAIAFGPDQRWSVLLPQHTHLMTSLGGPSTTWRGRKGITTDLNAAYFVEIIGLGASHGLVKVRTKPDGGRKPVPLLDNDVDGALVYPLLKGARHIAAFSYTPSSLVAIVPNQVISSVPSETSFSRDYPATYQYFRRINRVRDTEGVPLLESRSTWRKRMGPMGTPFYAIYNVGSYTFAPYKVVWAEMGGSIAAAIVSSEQLPYGLGRKPIVPDHKVYFVPADGEDAAHFLCAMLNSEPVKTFVDSFTVKIQVGTLFRHLKVPSYDSGKPHHQRLVSWSRQAHGLGINSGLQAKIDNDAWAVVRSM